MKKISVVLATFNEEYNLRRCLESVKDVADEIIVVDGTSTDNTVDIAKSFKAKVVVTDNPQIFHINKQKAIDLASGKWILQLDADEVVSNSLRKELERVVDKDPKENGYWIPRKNFFLGRFLMKGGQYPDYTIRFYRNGKGYLPQKDVHEQAVIKGDVGYLEHALLHYPYRSFSFYITKWNRYNRLAAHQLHDELKAKPLSYKCLSAIGYLILRPAHWFLTTYIRHKGFMDGWQGFAFSFFSAIRFQVTFIYYMIGNIR